MSVFTLAPRRNKFHRRRAFTSDARYNGAWKGKNDVSKRYRMTITFTGTAMLELDADTATEAAIKASELTVEDLARQGSVDVIALKVSARDIVPAALGSADDEDEAGPRRPRPSGWYRPV